LGFQVAEIRIVDGNSDAQQFVNASGRAADAQSYPTPEAESTNQQPSIGICVRQKINGRLHVCALSDSSVVGPGAPSGAAKIEA